jgi:penicillin-binding protein 1C
VRPRDSRIDERRYNTAHFLAFVRQHAAAANAGVTHTSLDLDVQYTVQQIVDARLHYLRDRHVQNAAALVVEHESNEIRAWVVGQAGKEDKVFNALDAVTVKRQPGSALKPLLYAAAMHAGWTAATMLDDAPLEESVGLGLHSYRNYSRAHYGLVSLREALGNSLNIPAVRAVQFVGPARFLAWLRNAGVDSLSGHANVYGDGLALGNGELSLYELVQAYTVLARMGDFAPLSLLADHTSTHAPAYRIISEDLASLLADILSDPLAREKEFGRYSVLNFPYQTAVKTGTSSDYRDAWAIGFNDRYTVGVWLGNMDYTEMNEVTGSTGPALALRAIFNELNRNRRVRPLYFSDKLAPQAVCVDSGQTADGVCEARDEWFVAGTGPGQASVDAAALRLRKPSKGLLLAMDPRIPDDQEYFEFAVAGNNGIEFVDWYVNEQFVGRTGSPRYAWKLEKGEHSAYAEVKMRDPGRTVRTDVVTYKVN